MHVWGYVATVREDWNVIYKQYVRMAEEVHEKLTIPRDAKRQINWNNLPAQ